HRRFRLDPRPRPSRKRKRWSSCAASSRAPRTSAMPLQKKRARSITKRFLLVEFGAMQPLRKRPSFVMKASNSCRWRAASPAIAIELTEAALSPRHEKGRRLLEAEPLRPMAANTGHHLAHAAAFS